MKIYLDRLCLHDVPVYDILPNSRIHFLNPRYHWDIINTYDRSRIMIPIIHEYHSLDLTHPLPLPSPPKTHLTAITPSQDQILLSYRFPQVIKDYNGNWYHNFEWGASALPEEMILDFPLVHTTQEAVNYICQGLSEMIKNLI